MSSVRVDLSVDGSGFQSELDEIIEGWDGHREAVLIALAESLVGSLKSEINTNTGRLKGTVRALETDGNTIPVAAGGSEGVDYTLPVLEGTEPHAPGPADPRANRSLSRWASRNNYPGGFGGIWGSIYHYGTEEHDFLSPALEEAEGESAGIAATVLRNRGVFE